MIKPPGGTPSADLPRTPEDIATTAEKLFTRKLDAATVPEAPDRAELGGVAAGFSKADLHDPKKADAMVRQVLGELIATDWGDTAGLSETQRKNLVDFMANDPAIRQQAERWLEKVLK